MSEQPFYLSFPLLPFLLQLHFAMAQPQMLLQMILPEKAILSGSLANFKWATDVSGKVR
jgi:hypothetical protein